MAKTGPGIRWHGRSADVSSGFDLNSFGKDRGFIKDGRGELFRCKADDAGQVGAPQVGAVEYRASHMRGRGRWSVVRFRRGHEALSACDVCSSWWGGAATPRDVRVREQLACRNGPRSRNRPKSQRYSGSIPILRGGLSQNGTPVGEMRSTLTTSLSHGCIVFHQGCTALGHPNERFSACQN